MNINDALSYGLLFAVASLIWQHHRIRHLAWQAAKRHTQLHEVFLLDEAIVLKKMKFRASHRSLFSFERHFQFEFSSLGDERYKGKVIFIGQKQMHIALDPFKTHLANEPID